MKTSSQWIAGGFALLLFAMTPVVICTAQDTPDQITLDSLSELYDGVTFDHVMHVDLAEDCSTCHHHTTGTGTTDARCARCHSQSTEQASVACRDCHVTKPFSAVSMRGLDPGAYHIDRPGLKGAYHLNCLGCHEQMGAPVGCNDCHQRNAAGDEFFHAGQYAPTGQIAGKQGH